MAQLPTRAPQYANANSDLHLDGAERAGRERAHAEAERAVDILEQPRYVPLRAHTGTRRRRVGPPRTNTDRHRHRQTHANQGTFAHAGASRSRRRTPSARSCQISGPRTHTTKTHHKNRPRAHVQRVFARRHGSVPARHHNWDMHVPHWGTLAGDRARGQRSGARTPRAPRAAAAGLSTGCTSRP